MDKSKKTVESLNILNKNGLLPMLIGELISSDSLNSADQCRKSIEMLTDFIEAMPDSEIEEKEKWLSLMENALEIAKRDLKYFEEK